MVAANGNLVRRDVNPEGSGFPPGSEPEARGDEVIHLCPFFNLHGPASSPPRSRVRAAATGSSAPAGRRHPPGEAQSLDEAENFLREGVTFEAVDPAASLA